MKKVIKRFVTIMLILTVLLTNIKFNNITLAKGSETANKNYFKDIPTFEIKPTSWTGKRGPIPGAVKGGTEYKNTYGDFADLTSFASIVAAIAGIPSGSVISKILTGAGIAAVILKFLPIKNLYYTSTYYEIGMECYYEYKYYADSGYSKYLYTEYSDVIGLWAR